MSDPAISADKMAAQVVQRAWDDPAYDYTPIANGSNKRQAPLIESPFDGLYQSPKRYKPANHRDELDRLSPKLQESEIQYSDLQLSNGFLKQGKELLEASNNKLQKKLQEMEAALVAERKKVAYLDAELQRFLPGDEDMANSTIPSVVTPPSGPRGWLPTPSPSPLATGTVSNTTPQWSTPSPLFGHGPPSSSPVLPQTPNTPSRASSGWFSQGSQHSANSTPSRTSGLPGQSDAPLTNFDQGLDDEMGDGPVFHAAPSTSQSGVSSALSPVNVPSFRNGGTTPSSEPDRDGDEEMGDGSTAPTPTTKSSSTNLSPVTGSKFGNGSNMPSGGFGAPAPASDGASSGFSSANVAHSPKLSTTEAIARTVLSAVEWSQLDLFSEAKNLADGCLRQLFASPERNSHYYVAARLGCQKFVVRATSTANNKVDCFGSALVLPPATSREQWGNIDEEKYLTRQVLAQLPEMQYDAARTFMDNNFCKTMKGRLLDSGTTKLEREPCIEKKIHGTAWQNTSVVLRANAVFRRTAEAFGREAAVEAGVVGCFPPRFTKPEVQAWVMGDKHAVRPKSFT